MKKFVLTSNGKEVKMGDKLILGKMVDTPMGEAMATYEVIISNENITALVKAGIIKPDKNVKTNIPMDIGYYIHKLAKRLGWTDFNYIDDIISVYPVAALFMILKEIAIETNKKYNNRVENSPEIYAISLMDGVIRPVNKANIKNYRNFAAFRSLEDAMTARIIVKDILEYVFEHEKEK